MVGQSKSSDALVWLGAAGRVSLEPPVNQPLTRLVKEVLAGALAVVGGGGGAGCGDCGGAVDATVPAAAAGGAGAGIDVAVPVAAAGAGTGMDVTVPAAAAGGAGAGGGDPEPVNPVNDEQPAKAVNAIMPAITFHKLRHSVPSLAAG